MNNRLTEWVVVDGERIPPTQQTVAHPLIPQPPTHSLCCFVLDLLLLLLYVESIRWFIPEHSIVSFN